ncbi:MAG: membrane protein insertion efficiency factor YidD [Pseudomonadota bacterium]|nr:membrane protein insertion efficiency factor YidD [Pseudomonadota bacterium]
MKAIALLAIRAYQRYISPHKGFCCAYSAHTGYKSCSVLGYRAIRLYGVPGGITVLQKRFERCKAAYQQRRLTLGSARKRQQGFLDCSCDLPCEMPSVETVENFCDILDWGKDCGDWLRSRKNADEETPPYLPPRR